MNAGQLWDECSRRPRGEDGQSGGVCVSLGLGSGQGAQGGGARARGVLALELLLLEHVGDVECADE